MYFLPVIRRRERELKAKLDRMKPVRYRSAVLSDALPISGDEVDLFGASTMLTFKKSAITVISMMKVLTR